MLQNNSSLHQHSNTNYGILHINFSGEDFTLNTTSPWCGAHRGPFGSAD